VNTAILGALADLTVVAHLLFIVFMAVGGLLALRWRWFPWVHLPAAVWGVLLELRGWYCPLTSLERWLRVRSGGAGYDGGFVEHYLLPVIYPSALTREIQIGLGLLLLGANGVVYGAVWAVGRRRRDRG
jgi:hypothetical protein